jgi:hypothetical protein
MRKWFIKNEMAWVILACLVGYVAVRQVIQWLQ